MSFSRLKYFYLSYFVWFIHPYFMSELIFSGRIPITATSTDIPSMMKCDITQSDSLDIRIIDCNDLFNFYCCSISTGDFYMMKSEQGIRVDYDRFIRIVVDMFSSIGKGTLHGVFEDGKFLFVEKNEFRNIVRLELKFDRPEENEYKKYLGDIIRKMEEDNIKFVKENMQLKEQYGNLERDNKKRIKMLEEDYFESKRKIDNLLNMTEELKRNNKDRIKEVEEYKYKIKENDNKMRDLEYEVERYKIKEQKNDNLIERAEEMVKEIEEKKNEIKVANEIIKKLRIEIKEIKNKQDDFSIEREKEKKDIKKIKKENEEFKRNNKI
ncbi:hypothetical protein SLOPH_1677, partial [Spraguea lophii 42_110]